MMTRRSLLATAIAGTMGTAAPQTKAPPRILLVTCENLSPHLGCYGYAPVSTPAFDAFAAESMRYDRAYAVSTVPAVSRSSIQTGMYPVSTGTHFDGRAALPSFMKTLSECCRAADGSSSLLWRRLDAVNPSRIRMRDAAYDRMVKPLKSTQRGIGADAPLPTHFEDNEENHRDWEHYHELISVLDMQFAAALKQAGPETIVIFVSEYGFTLEEGNSGVYESGTRVPLLIRVPGQRAGGSTRMVSLIDLPATILNLAGVSIPSFFQGQAFLGERLAPQRRFVYAACDRARDKYRFARSVRDARYRYIYDYSNGVEELYDTAADPNEVKDLSKVETSVASRMREQLERWRNDVHDLGLMPDAELAVREGMYRTRWSSARQPGFDILQRKLTAIVPAKEEIKIREAFADEESAVRYWACAKADPARFPRELESMLGDNSGAVRVAAARQLGRSKLLIREMRSPEEWVRYLAVLALDGELAAKPALQELVKIEKNKTVSAAALRLLKGMP